MAPKKRNSSAGGGDAKKFKKSVDTEKAALDVKCINTIRVLAADMVEKANSGHPGAPMGCAPIAHLLWSEFMDYNPKNPKWFNRDRFILSNGHACALLYSLDDLKAFRQLNSITPGHPENFMTPGVEVCTGPLGQGISNAVGIAMAEKHLAAVFNKDDCEIINHFTYVICGDGCLQEGVSSEASSLAGHLGLGKLIVCYDDNHITIDGDTDVSFTEDVIARYKSYGWHTQVVSDVNDLDAVRAAITKAKGVTDKPSIIKIRTVIGQGSSKEGTEKVHGAPLGAEDLKKVKEVYGFDPTQSFVVPEDVAAHYATVASTNSAKEDDWKTWLAKYEESSPDQAKELIRRIEGALPEGWREAIPEFPFPEPKTVATRNRSEEVLNAVAPVISELIGGSADLTGSNLTQLRCSGDFQKDTPAGRYIRFGVREHGMAAICNGLIAHGGVRPFCATFLNFIGYALGSVRLSALSRFGVIYVMTHDSIGQGEDGPTHQPIELLESLRATPNLLVIRPCDGKEVAGAYEQALLHAHTPTVIALTRQAVTAITGSSREKVAHGAYVVGKHGPEGASALHLVIAATGSEVVLAEQTAELLSHEGVSVQVVSMPCWELFDNQPLEYQLEVFPEGVPVMSVEAAGIHGWTKYSHAQFGMTGFGKSAPGGKLFQDFGFTKENLVERAKQVIAFYPNGAPSLLKRPKFPVFGSH